MAGQRGTIEFTVEGQKIAALTAGPAAGPAADVVADGGGDRGRSPTGCAAERIKQAKRPEFHSLDLVLGVGIEGSPVIAGGRGAGALLPRAWLGPGRSLYDALGQGFTLVRRPGAGDGTIEKAARGRGVPLRVLELPNSSPDHCGPADGLALIDQVRGAVVSARFQDGSLASGRWAGNRSTGSARCAATTTWPA